MLLPFVFYFTEICKYYHLFQLERIENPHHQLQRLTSVRDVYHRYKVIEHEIYSKIQVEWWLYSWLVPLMYIWTWITWPLKNFIYNVYYSYKMELNETHNKIDKYQKWHLQYRNFATRGQVIEVITEASLQSMYQLYLVMPALVGSVKDAIELGNWTIHYKQMISIALSVFSITYSFTGLYRKKKYDALPIFSLGFLLHFGFTLLFVISRLLSFQAFAYFFGPADFLYPLIFIFCHAGLMAFFHGYIHWTEFKNAKETPVNIIYNCVLNGLANIFVHNKIEIYNEKTSKNPHKMCPKQPEPPGPGNWIFCGNLSNRNFGIRALFKERRTRCRQILFDAFFAIENAVMLAFGFSSNLYFKDQLFQEVMKYSSIVVAVTFLMGVVLKILFYQYIHMWSELIECSCGESASKPNKRGEGENFEMAELMAA